MLTVLVNPKKAGGGQFHPPTSYDFSKNVSSR